MLEQNQIWYLDLLYMFDHTTREICSTDDKDFCHATIKLEKILYNATLDSTKTTKMWLNAMSFFQFQ